MSLVATSSPLAFETPSKKAASSLEHMSLRTPTKPSSSSTPRDVFTSTDFDDDEEVVLALSQKTVDSADVPASDSADGEAVEEWRTRFVGDVDIDEKDEPLLKESKRRFVLFPIQYHEVRDTRPFNALWRVATRSDALPMHLTRV
jgi:ribonucleoside-diphosphate reductase subunit M2